MYRSPASGYGTPGGAGLMGGGWSVVVGAGVGTATLGITDGGSVRLGTGSFCSSCTTRCCSMCVGGSTMRRSCVAPSIGIARTITQSSAARIRMARLSVMGYVNSRELPAPAGTDTRHDEFGGGRRASNQPYSFRKRFDSPEIGRVGTLL